MAFIGNTNTTQAFTPAIDYFSGNGSTVAFTLSRPVASVAQVQCAIENVPQNPTSAFTVSGNTITFSSAPPSGSNNIYVYYTSPITQVATLSQAPSVIGPMLVSIGGGTALGGTTNPITAMSGASSNYVQSYVINQTNGTSSSADFVAYPSNGADAHGWVDMGITSLSYADTTYTVTGPNESYLFASAPSGSGTTGNLVIATDNTGTANSIQFYTGGFTQAKSAARMTIDGATGNLLVGTVTAIDASALTSILGTSTKYSLALKATATTASYQVVFWNPNGAVGSVTTTGSSTAYVTSSDYRLKENVQPMQNALATVSQLNPVTYTWKTDGSEGQGFIAHELQAVVPECVTGEKDAVDADGNPVYQGIDTSFLVATLTAAIKEQQAIIASLTARIEALEAK